MNFDLSFRRYNERAVLVNWPNKINETMLEDILRFKKIIEQKYIEQKVEIINAYTSILIIYEYTIEDINSIFKTLKELYLGKVDNKFDKQRTWTIPVCYHPNLAMDLVSVSNRKNYSVDEFVRRHSSSMYTIFFMGFLPGFMYLGGMDKSLAMDRKEKPRLNIPKGAVAIGGEQTGIYPIDSPGGWHIIGRTPVAIFNVGSSPPCAFQSGDNVKFEAISIETYNVLVDKVNRGDYQLNPN